MKECFVNRKLSNYLVAKVVLSTVKVLGETNKILFNSCISKSCNTLFVTIWFTTSFNIVEGIKSVITEFGFLILNPEYMCQYAIHQHAAFVKKTLTSLASMRFGVRSEFSLRYLLIFEDFSTWSSRQRCPSAFGHHLVPLATKKIG